MINLYHVPFTRSFRVIWLCEELVIPYQLTAVDFSPEYRASEEWRKLNPVGKVPVMTDGELTMFESGAMVQYLLDRYGNGQLQPPAGTKEHAIYLQWSWFAEATFSRPIGEVVNHGRAFAEPIQAVVDEMKARGQLALEAVDQALADRPYLLGDDFSAADIMTGYTVMLADRMLKNSFPTHAAGYWQRLQEREAFKATKAAEQAMGQ